MQKFIPAMLTAAALVAVPASLSARERLAPEAELARLLEGRVAGEPEDCITLHSVRNSQIIDNTAIVYRIGSTLWVNRPEGGAHSLDDDDVLLTKLHSSQLCSIDTVELRDRVGLFYNGFVSLGEFVPYRRVAAAQ